MSFIDQMVSPSDMHNILRGQEAYTVNRERAAAALHDGFAVYDAYDRAKPFLFVAALAGMAASAYAWRKRKDKRPESTVLYALTFAMSAATAVITRPTIGAAADPNADASASSGPSQPPWMVQHLDKRVAELKTFDPDFADKEFQRLVQVPGIKGGWDSLPPLAKAIVL